MSEPIPERIGSYRVIRLVGEGGMGQVFEAVQEQIERRVAIKVLLPEYARDAEVAQRFFNEARATNIIGHAGIVTVFELGYTADGTAFIVMEFLDGESLRQRIKRCGRLGRDALRITRQVAGALAAAHDKGIVHRDLKPDNIMLVADSEVASGERAKILDFGIAKLLGDGGPDQLRTRTGVLMGTPSYMSPEQCGRPGAGIADRTDVYALGIILFEMLTGAVPFKGSEIGQILGQHIFAEPPPLPVTPEVPYELVQLVRRMLAKEPAERPSMRDIVRVIGMLAPSQVNAPVPVSVPVPVAAPVAPEHGDTVYIRDSQDHTRISAAHSTLGRSAGQYQSRSGRVVKATLLLCGVFGGAALLMHRGQRPAPRDGQVPGAAPAGVPQTVPVVSKQPTVMWRLQSTPAGAQVIRVSDRQSLGQTPWETELIPVGGEVALVLRKPGYKDLNLILNTDRDTERQLILTRELRPGLPLPATKPAVPSVPGPAPPPVAWAPVAQPPLGRSAPAASKSLEVSVRDPLAVAHLAYVRRLYRIALTSALKSSASGVYSAEAWRLIGLSACYEREFRWANAAYRNLGQSEKIEMLHVCRTNRLRFSKDGFIPDVEIVD